MKSRNTQKRAFRPRQTKKTRKGSVRTAKKQHGGDLGSELHQASKDGNVKKVRDLIEAGANIEQQTDDAEGNTPLIFASGKNHVNVVRELIKAGADLDKSNKDGHTPLLFASKWGHLDVARELIKAGADINKADKKYNHTPLLIAAAWEHPEIVRELLQAGALNANPAHASHVLDNAIESQNADMIKMVVKTLNEDHKLRKAVPDKDAIQADLIKFAEETDDDDLLDYLVSVGIFSKGMRKLREKDRQKIRMKAVIPENMPKKAVDKISGFMGGRRKTKRKPNTQRRTRRKSTRTRR